ncbi:MAG: diacylglycerol kinase [Thermodesulfobacteriota bacterium]
MIEKRSGRGLIHLTQALAWSLAGLRSALANEEAFRLELVLCLFLVPLAIWLGNDGLSRSLLIGSLFIVLIVELLNTAVETVVDRFGNEWHTLSGRAKNLGSAAVLLSLVNAAIVWLFVLF